MIRFWSFKKESANWWNVRAQDIFKFITPIWTKLENLKSESKLDNHNEMWGLWAQRESKVEDIVKAVAERVSHLIFPKCV